MLVQIGFGWKKNINNLIIMNLYLPEVNKFSFFYKTFLTLSYSNLINSTKNMFIHKQMEKIEHAYKYIT